MDPVTLGMAKAYTDRKTLGMVLADTETGAFSGKPAEWIDARVDEVGGAQFASQITIDSTTTAVQINAWLATASALGVKRSIGQTTITDPITLPSNVNWDATGTTLVLGATTAKSMLVNDWTAGNKNVKVIGLTLDGNRKTENDPRPPASWHAIYLKKIDGLTLDNVTVLWPLAFGGLITDSRDIYLTNYRTHSEHINQDGIHFFDCEDVTIDGIHGVAGDDLLGISAQYADVRNFTVANVIGTSKHASLVRVNQTDRSVAAGESRTIENLTFTGLIGYDCANKGISFNDLHSSSTLRGIRVVDSTFVRAARSGVDIVRAQDSEFDVTLIGCGTGIGVTSGLTLHPFYAVTLIRSRVHARVIGVTDGYNGIHIAGGNSLTINPEVQYPTSGFTNAQNCIFVGSITDSLIADGFTDGGGRAVQLGSSTLSTVRTRVRGLVIRNNTGFSIAEGTGSDSNLIEGNLIRNGGISKAGANTKIRRNDGVYVTENYGVATIASGGTSITVNHGMNATPTVINLTGRHAETADAIVNTISTSQFQIVVPGAVTADRQIMWEARV
ncbi:MULTISPECIES: hypothetical protein [Microbacterium]|uniref:hypothetical protein n=1 Tax=Microbacterium TaxID=33882 RepID=UPI00278895ED|nr:MULTISPECIES: hypothetical protein [Microbacterium]MDQ1084181.1 hypothetical protein [Microbacterium sp. SORGH_AS_0344]MDQ1170544.1 hypothetical protein [Microbacterium proteolyticum]